MSKENYRQFYITGIRAFQSASKQGTEQASIAIEKFNDQDLKTVAKKASHLFVKQNEVLASFLKEDNAPINEFHDQIMDGVGRGTSLMIKAAKDALMLDVALVSGATVGLQYFVNSFKEYAANSKMLGYDERIKSFEELAEDNQELVEEYAAIIQSKILPQIMKD